MSFEVIETYDEASLLNGLMDVHVKYAGVTITTAESARQQQEAARTLADAE